MKVIVTTLTNDHPVTHRVPIRPARTRRSSRHSPRPTQARCVPRPPGGSNFKFRELFAAIARIRPLKKNARGSFLTTQVAVKEIFNKLTK
jgi:hypothetical protein